jgi:hypothetical protein
MGLTRQSAASRRYQTVFIGRGHPGSMYPGIHGQAGAPTAPLRDSYGASGAANCRRPVGTNRRGTRAASGFSLNLARGKVEIELTANREMTELAPAKTETKIRGLLCRAARQGHSKRDSTPFDRLEDDRPAWFFGTLPVFMILCRLCEDRGDIGWAPKGKVRPQGPKAAHRSQWPVFSPRLPRRPAARRKTS